MVLIFRMLNLWVANVLDVVLKLLMSITKLDFARLLTILNMLSVEEEN